MMDVTFSKQCIHFFRSLRWPPTSNMLYRGQRKTWTFVKKKSRTGCSAVPWWNASHRYPLSWFLRAAHH
jgi:hypothetical protein